MPEDQEPTVEFGSALETVYLALEELNRQVPREERLDKSPSTRLFDGSEGLDSLQLVNMIVLTEQAVADRFGVTIELIPDGTAVTDENPFESVGTLARFIQEQLNDQN